MCRKSRQNYQEHNRHGALIIQILEQYTRHLNMNLVKMIYSRWKYL